MSRKSRKHCYICGKMNVCTRDHVPPRGIFPQKIDAQLITVPICDRCNQEYQPIDEQFRNYLVIMSNDSIEGINAWKNQVVKSFNKNPGARKQLLDNLFTTWGKHKKNNLVIPAEAMFIPKIIIDKQIDRIIRGIYYSKYEKPLCLTLNIEIIDRIDDARKGIPAWQGFFEKLGYNLNWCHVIKGIFSYFINFAVDDKNRGMAILVFYNSLIFTSFIESKFYAR